MSRIDSSLLLELLNEDLGHINEDMLTSDMSIEAASKLWLTNSLLKKFEEVEAPDAHDKAIDKFLAYNNKCASFVLQPTRLFDEEIIGGVKTLLDDWLHFNGEAAGLSDFVKAAELGSGASVATETTSFYTKMFDSGLSTANPDLRVLYRNAASQHPTWSQAETARCATHGDRAVSGSKISTVPKQFDIKRTICTEPVLEMYFQRGIGNFMESVMKRRLGLSLDTQPDKNRELARLGSLYGTFGTTDLRSASDSISITLVKEVFPRYFVNWLMRTRCKQTILPDGEQVELHMVSSMGNGFTFALQTMLFASIVVSCYRLLGIRPLFQRRKVNGTILEPNVGVFGDDIAVRSDAYSLVNHALTMFGFEVNDDKSFNNGDFRESCGHDYFRGVDIRGVYIKTLATEQDCYSAVNRLIRWSVRSGCNLDLTISYLLGSVSFLPIPYRDGDDEGIKVPWTCAKVSYFSTATRSPLYWARVNVSNSYPVPESAEQLEQVEFQRMPFTLRYNGAGILLALIGGFVRDGRLTIRQDRKRSKVRQRSVPFWDYVPAADTVQYRGRDWQVAAEDLFFRIGLSLK